MHAMIELIYSLFRCRSSSVPNVSDKDSKSVLIPNTNGVTNFQLMQQQMQTNQPLSTTQIHPDQFQFKV